MHYCVRCRNSYWCGTGSTLYCKKLKTKDGKDKAVNWKTPNHCAMYDYARSWAQGMEPTTQQRVHERNLKRYRSLNRIRID